MKAHEIIVGDLYLVNRHGLSHVVRVDSVTKHKRGRNPKDRFAPDTGTELIWKVTSTTGESWNIGTHQKFIQKVPTDKSLAALFEEVDHDRNNGSL